jgi:hypothetical protein
LTTRLIQLARQRGIDGLVGNVLPENAAVLRLCRKLGFTIGIDPGDPELLRISKRPAVNKSSMPGLVPTCSGHPRLAAVTKLLKNMV